MDSFVLSKNVGKGSSVLLKNAPMTVEEKLLIRQDYVGEKYKML